MTLEELQKQVEFAAELYFKYGYELDMYHKAAKELEEYLAQCLIEAEWQ